MAAQEAGIASPPHRQDIMRLLDAHLDPTRPGSAMDINAMPLENLGREALAEQVHNMFVLGDRDGNGVRLQCPPPPPFPSPGGSRPVTSVFEDLLAPRMNSNRLESSGFCDVRV